MAAVVAPLGLVGELLRNTADGNRRFAASEIIAVQFPEELVVFDAVGKAIRAHELKMLDVHISAEASERTMACRNQFSAAEIEINEVVGVSATTPPYLENSENNVFSNTTDGVGAFLRNDEDDDEDADTADDEQL